MDPRKAVAQIEAMNSTIALEILARMKEKKAASLLAAMTPKKAARFSERLVQDHRSPAP